MHPWDNIIIHLSIKLSQHKSLVLDDVQTKVRGAGHQHVVPVHSLDPSQVDLVCVLKLPCGGVVYEQVSVLRANEDSLPVALQG